MYKKPDKILGEVLVERGTITLQTLEAILQEIEKSAEEEVLTAVLVKRGVISEKEALAILAEKLKLPFMELKDVNIEPSIVEKVPVRIASYYRFVPLKIEDRTLTIAVSLPLDMKIEDEIRTHLGYSNIKVVLSPSVDISDKLRNIYGRAAQTLERIISHSPTPAVEITPQAELEKIEDIERLAEDASIINLVNQIILEAYKKRATDIHIEPYRGQVVMRYRIDGVLYDARIPSEVKRFLAPIISRIKIMSNLNIVERRLPQDGRAVVKVAEQMLDLRISTLPTPYGESMVIRILPTQMLFSLDKLGLSAAQVELFKELISKPHGIIFVTGPTGSGKTTTLYACLSNINTKERKIITLEDPIEYEMKGITQVQVMPQIGLDFARGLRSILRHDPDVMMIGEVRDLETAEIAIRVALTGHLVFSTLHTNDAASGITRLLDIGVEPYLVASSIEAFIAQRLVRVLCSQCKYEDTAAYLELRKEIAEALGLESIEEVRIFKSRGCQKCNFSGFYGRTAIYEIILIDEVIKDLIFKRMPAGEIKKAAIKRGMRTLRQAGWQKVIAGITSPEEVMEVTPQEEVFDYRSQFFQERLLQQEVRKPGAKEDTVVSEKRVYRRLCAKTHLVYKVFKSPQDLLKRGFSPEQLTTTKNVSAGGLLFACQELLPVGALLELKIELPDDKKPIECLGRILRVEEKEVNKTYDIAVCFLGIASADRSRLNRYVEA
jgi:type II secretory ATPase GspE/PulE/Tfp pilus assembly ATPase PilB-like protein